MNAAEVGSGTAWDSTTLEINQEVVDFGPGLLDHKGVLARADFFETDRANSTL